MTTDRHHLHDSQQPRDHHFLLGLLAGAVAGAGLAVWFAPKAGSALRRRIRSSAKELTSLAADGCEQASDRVGAAMAGVADKAKHVRNEVASAVAQGAREVERQAMAMKR